MVKKKCLHCGGFLGKYAYRKLNSMHSAYNYIYVCKKCGKVSVYNYVNDISYKVPVKWGI